MAVSRVPSSAPAPASPLKHRLRLSLKDVNAAADIWEILAADQTQAENRSCREGWAPDSGDMTAWACRGPGWQSQGRSWRRLYLQTGPAYLGAPFL